MRLVVSVAAVVVAVAALWFAGETHRSNCIDESKRGCSVLPWSGHEPSKSERQEAIDEAIREAYP